MEIIGKRNGGAKPWKRYSLIRQRTIIWSVRARLTDSRQACKLEKRPTGRFKFSNSPLVTSREHPSVQTRRYGVNVTPAADRKVASPGVYRNGLERKNFSRIARDHEIGN